MSYGLYSESALNLQFNAVMNIFDGQTMWVSWVYSTRPRHEHSEVRRRWYGKKYLHTEVKHLPYQECEMRRTAVPYRKIGPRMVEVDVPPNFTVNFDGVLHGVRVYNSEHAKDWIMFAPFNGNTNKVTKGCSVSYGPFIIDIKGC